MIEHTVESTNDRPSGLLVRPADARWLMALAHGAGAGMRHPFMAALAAALADVGVATLRYEFPYIERGARRPDRPEVLIERVRAAIDVARDLEPDLPLLAGGKSMGGRMTSNAAAETLLEGVRGLVFFGFPLHARGRPGTTRGDHLDTAGLPMLFVQGTRDTFAAPELLGAVLARLGDRATLHPVDGADHGFHVLKRAGRTEADVMLEISTAVDDWTRALAAK